MKTPPHLPPVPEGFVYWGNYPLCVAATSVKDRYDIIAVANKVWDDTGWYGTGEKVHYALRLNSPIEIANRQVPVLTDCSSFAKGLATEPPYQILSLRYRCTCKCGQTDGYKLDIEDGDSDVELAIHLDMEERGWIDGRCPACYQNQNEPEPYTGEEDI